MAKATIIIPTCNRLEDLKRCIQTLLPQLPKDGSAVIEVCDDSSTDESRKMIAAEFPFVKWRQGPRKGPAANRNLGGKSADSEWLIFIDDDCIPRKTYVAAYLEAFETAGSRGLFHGLTFPLPDPPSMYYESPFVTKAHKIFPSCNFAIRKQLFESTGGFDERYYPSFEDIEYFARLDRLGADAGCVTDAAVDHPIRPIPNYRKLAARWEARVVSAMDLGATPLQVAILLPKHVFLVILSRFRGARPSRQNLRATIAFAREFIHFMFCLPGWIRKHAKEPRSPFWEEQVALGKGPFRFGL
jgi:GT2 family glycosyltransferase